MLEGNTKGENLLEGEIIKHIQDHIPECLTEYYTANIQRIAKIVNTKIEGILVISKKEISQERGLMLAMKQVKHSLEVSKLLYKEYRKFMEEYCPNVKKICGADFSSSGFNFIGNNKKIYWKEIFFKGLRPGMKIQKIMKGIVQTKVFTIESITNKGELKLKGNTKRLAPQYAVLAVE
jgi:hypothetical protein